MVEELERRSMLGVDLELHHGEVEEAGLRY
jgi:hypothetical protein